MSRNNNIDGRQAPRSLDVIAERSELEVLQGLRAADPAKLAELLAEQTRRAVGETTDTEDLLQRVLSDEDWERHLRWSSPEPTVAHEHSPALWVSRRLPWLTHLVAASVGGLAVALALQVEQPQGLIETPSSAEEARELDAVIPTSTSAPLVSTRVAEAEPKGGTLLLDPPLVGTRLPASVPDPARVIIDDILVMEVVGRGSLSTITGASLSIPLRSAELSESLEEYLKSIGADPSSIARVEFRFIANDD